MKNLTAHQEYLLLGKVSNTLSEQESEEWEQMVQHVPEVAIAYEQFMQQLPAGDVAGRFSYVDEPGYWDDLTASFKEPARIRRLPFGRRRWVAAAIAIGVLAGSALLWNNLRKQDTATNMAATAKPGVELRLADGSVVNLSRQQGNIQTGATQLNNTNKRLTYSSSDADASVINILTVPVGLDYKISLADGTEVWMNSATELKFPLAFPDATREVSINGEAYLKVAKDPAKPFIVHLPNSTVQVLGTEFNVNTYDPGTAKVALIEGAVNMRSLSGESTLAPGRQAIYQDGQAIQQRTFDAKVVLGWQKGLFFFDEMPLKEIAKVVPRWFGMQVIIDDPAISDKKFVGVLDRNQPISAFQDDLKLIAGIDSYVDKDNVLHFR
ncbi:FecR family protein [Chitinophaga sp. XS-30]|uniref:FecR family protein n=1 Tax=Chitinophaga sp. XS-30 TaxID=2604421 RepID=UPI0011DE4849|nr:FecR domain-containing protein [Chitinophaga sp. XS-30]QEH41551.1 DUF4974 domain-containing protein [Chitinophaga sp. XS-30]